MFDRERDDLPQSAALWELYNRKRALESKQEKKNDLAKEVEALAKEEEVLEKEAARIVQKRRIVDAKCKTRRAELAQVSAGCESDKADLQRSWRYMPPAATRTGRISRPPPRYSPTLRATNSTRASPYASANNGRAAVGQLASQPSYRTVVDDTPANSRSKRNQQRREEDPELSGHVQKKRKTAAATPKPYTIDFADVFQEGFAQHKHMIIQYPPGSDQWYILRCDVHRRHFKQNPLYGAANHLRAAEHQGPERHLDIDMSEWPVRWASTIKKMGLRVLNCDATKAEKNNAAFTQALDAGYKPLGPDPNQQSTRRRHTRSLLGHGQHYGKRSQRTHPDRLPERSRKSMNVKLSRSLSRGSPILDTGVLVRVAKAELTKSIPACYERQNGTVLQWAEGYRDGERLVNKRQFPVMWFHDAQTFSLQKDLMIPDPVWYSWLRAADLQPFSDNGEFGENKRPRGYNSALEYANQLDRIKAAKHPCSAKAGNSRAKTTGPLSTESVAGDATDKGQERADTGSSKVSSENEDWNDRGASAHRLTQNLVDYSAPYRRHDAEDERESHDDTTDDATEGRLGAAWSGSSPIEGQETVGRAPYSSWRC
ncbi:hypothetical protein PG995_004513 [Apiospora arundinis]